MNDSAENRESMGRNADDAAVNDPVDAHRDTPEEKGGFGRVLLITLLIALGIRIFIAQPFIVNGQSMEPTFASGEYLIVDELTFRFRPPERGEVVVFRFPKNDNKFFIKRIIGLPGETIDIRDGAVIIQKDGESFALREPYLDEGGLSPMDPVTLGTEEYFVMGDNRDASSDSRSWGPVSKDRLVGRVIFRFLPITEFEIKPGAAVLP